jgi:hypothetical protein
VIHDVFLREPDVLPCFNDIGRAVRVRVARHVRRVVPWPPVTAVNSGNGLVWSPTAA